MEFYVELTAELTEASVCIAGQELASGLLNDYLFDKAFSKVVYLDFSQPDGAIDIGEISLNEEDREGSELFLCYVKMDI